ncbi:hypothetical protein [Peribacillus frigoritolerans]|uniref:hypothetical protein n=1 Tax=Peribacillus frigoritolerans TaxID=450367 RepID=UPI00203D5EC4|nr:hypothetical protein [Peribacillus frigoritolerans]MCM3166013.1 hypothetical protein [Peribacillus frigoritolerans]
MSCKLFTRELEPFTREFRTNTREIDVFTGEFEAITREFECYTKICEVSARKWSSSQEIEVLLVIKLFWRISIKRRMDKKIIMKTPG